MPTCPHCEGRGWNRALVRTSGQGCVPRVMPCFECLGSGEVGEEQLARDAAGSRLRDLRRSMRLSRREAAGRLGMSPVAFNALEWGKEGVTIARIDAAVQALMRMDHG